MKFFKIFTLSFFLVVGVRQNIHAVQYSELTRAAQKALTRSGLWAQLTNSGVAQKASKEQMNKLAGLVNRNGLPAAQQYAQLLETNFGPNGNSLTKADLPNAPFVAPRRELRGASAAAAAGQYYQSSGTLPPRNLGAAARGRPRSRSPAARTRSPSPANTVRVGKDQLEKLKKMEGAALNADGSIQKDGIKYIPEGWARSYAAGQPEVPRGRSPTRKKSPAHSRSGSRERPDSGVRSRPQSPAPPVISKTAEQVLIDNINSQIAQNKMEPLMALQIVMSNAFKTADQADSELLEKIVNTYPKTRGDLDFAKILKAMKTLKVAGYEMVDVVGVHEGNTKRSNLEFTPLLKEAYEDDTLSTFYINFIDQMKSGKSVEQIVDKIVRTKISQTPKRKKVTATTDYGKQIAEKLMSPFQDKVLPQALSVKPDDLARELTVKLPTLLQKSDLFDQVVGKLLKDQNLRRAITKDNYNKLRRGVLICLNEKFRPLFKPVLREQNNVEDFRKAKPEKLEKMSDQIASLRIQWQTTPSDDLRKQLNKRIEEISEAIDQEEKKWRGNFEFDPIITLGNFNEKDVRGARRFYKDNGDVLKIPGWPQNYNSRPAGGGAAAAAGGPGVPPPPPPLPPGMGGAPPPPPPLPGMAGPRVALNVIKPLQARDMTRKLSEWLDLNFSRDLKTQTLYIKIINYLLARDDNGNVLRDVRCVSEIPTLAENLRPKNQSPKGSPTARRKGGRPAAGGGEDDSEIPWLKPVLRKTGGPAAAAAGGGADAAGATPFAKLRKTDAAIARVVNNVLGDYYNFVIDLRTKNIDILAPDSIRGFPDGSDVKQQLYGELQRIAELNKGKNPKLLENELQRKLQKFITDTTANIKKHIGNKELMKIPQFAFVSGVVLDKIKSDDITPVVYYFNQLSKKQKYVQAAEYYLKFLKTIQ